MDISKVELKLAAKFLGYETKTHEGDLLYKAPKCFWRVISQFNPHEKTGRHLSVEILEKFDKFQWLRYQARMHTEFYKMEPNTRGDIVRFQVTAPTEVIFKCIIKTLKYK